MFDLDGTLADTVDLILQCFRHTMRVHLGEAPPDSRWLATLGTPLRAQLTPFARSNEEVKEMMRTYTAFQSTIHDEMVRPYVGAKDLLLGLESKGVPMALVTSKRRDMALRTLCQCDLADHFEVIVSADDVTRGKPDPEPVLKAIEALGLVPSRSIVLVGDSPHDMVAGKRAGVRTAAALWGPFQRTDLERAGADHFLDSPLHLLEGIS